MVFEEYKEENILNEIFNSRIDEIAILNEEDKKFLKNNEIEIDFLLQDIFDTININKLDINYIKYKLIEYENNLSFITGYFNEKYYKAGFKDAMNLLNNCIKKE